ncbi:beta-carotene hydroxylase, partial [Trifolium pratense]
MAAELSTATTLKPYNLPQTLTSPKTTSTLLFFTPLRDFRHSKILQTQTRTTTKKRFTVCVITEDPKNSNQIKTEENSEPPINKTNPHFLVAQKLARKKSQRFTYLVAAVMSSFGVTSMAILAVYYRFSWQMEGGGEVPWSEMFGTFALSVGAAVGMEFWARWAHKVLWHASLWHMHE